MIINDMEERKRIVAAAAQWLVDRGRIGWWEATSKKEWMFTEWETYEIDILSIYNRAAKKQGLPLIPIPVVPDAPTPPAPQLEPEPLPAPQKETAPEPNREPEPHPINTLHHFAVIEMLRPAYGPTVALMVADKLVGQRIPFKREALEAAYLQLRPDFVFRDWTSPEPEPKSEPARERSTEEAPSMAEHRITPRQAWDYLMTLDLGQHVMDDLAYDDDRLLVTYNLQAEANGLPTITELSEPPMLLEDPAAAIERAGWTKAQGNRIAMDARHHEVRFYTGEEAVQWWEGATGGKMPRRKQAGSVDVEEPGSVVVEEPQKTLSPGELDALILTYLKANRGDAYTYNDLKDVFDVEWREAMLSARRLAKRQTETGVVQYKVPWMDKGKRKTKELYKWSPVRARMDAHPDQAQVILEYMVWGLVRSSDQPISKTEIDRQARKMLGHVSEGKVIAAIATLEEGGYLERTQVRNWHLFQATERRLTRPNPA